MDGFGGRRDPWLAHRGPTFPPSPHPPPTRFLQKDGQVMWHGRLRASG